jgi:predicted DNA binding CopG/RHH family protein
MAEPMNSPKIPQTDSIQELARFWDAHDITDFADQLEEMTDPVFERQATIKLRLEPHEAEAVRQMAESAGTDSVKLIHQWVIEKIETSGSPRR